MKQLYVLVLQITADEFNRVAATDGVEHFLAVPELRLEAEELLGHDACFRLADERGQFAGPRSDTTNKRNKRALADLSIPMVASRILLLNGLQINPRFGGGTPLSLHAGADFPRWLLQMACGDDPGDIREAFEPGMYMLRFDDAIFLQGLPQIKKL